MKPSFVSLVQFIIGWPLSILAIFFILRLTSAHITDVFTLKPNMPMLLGSVVSFVVYFFLRSYIWKHILLWFGKDIPFKEVAFLWSISELKRYVPGNIWSFLSRSFLFSKKEITKEVLIRALFTEAQLMLLGGLVASVLAIPSIVPMFFPVFSYLSFLYPLIYLFCILLVGCYIYGRVVIRYLPFSEKKYFRFILPQFSPTVNTIQLLVSVFSFFLFGLGTYLGIGAVTYLNPTYILQFSGFFIISFFIGYLSFITPMGLGVREAALIVGLTKFVQNSTQASIFAIFARLIFIFSELLAIVLAYLWYKTKNKFLAKTETLISKYSPETVLLLTLLLYILYFTLASFLRFDNFYTGRFDLGNMDQTVWNTSNGRIFQLTNPDGTNVLSRLAFHADFILILLTPFYYLWSHPKMLLLLQTIALSCGALFIYLIGRKILNNRGLSTVLAVAYLLNPSVQYINLYDFHAVALAVPFLLGAFYFILSKKYWWFFLFAILAGLTKEHVWLIIALLGGYIALIQKQKLKGAFVFIVSISIFYLLLWYVIPNARGGEHFALSYYSDFGDSPSSVIKSMIFSPDKIIKTIIQPAQLSYLNQLLKPLGYIPFFAPFLLVFAAPDLLINLLSSNGNFHQIYYQYTATITPFLFISSIYGSSYLLLKVKIPAVLISTYLFSMTLFSAYTFGPLPGAKNPNITMFTKAETNREIINSTLGEIPATDSIAATNNLGAHLSHRQFIYTIPVGIANADVVAFLLDDPFAQPSPKAQRDMVEQLKNNNDYQLLIQKDNFVVFRKIR